MCKLCETLKDLPGGIVVPLSEETMLAPKMGEEIFQRIIKHNPEIKITHEQFAMMVIDAPEIIQNWIAIAANTLAEFKISEQSYNQQIEQLQKNDKILRERLDEVTQELEQSQAGEINNGD